MLGGFRMDVNLRQEIALFRYSLIAPLITETFTQKSAKEYLEQVSAKKHATPQGTTKEYAPETLKEWLRNYRKYGIDGLYPKMRSDKGQLRKLPDSAKEFIVSSKLTSPKRSAKSIYQELIAKGYVPYDQVSLSTVQRFITKSNLTSKKLEPIDRRAFEFEFANDCWQSDISVGPYLTINGKKLRTYIFVFIDDATRVIAHCEAFFSESFLSLLAAFKKGVAKRGIPKRLFVDNGKVYKSDQMQFICANLGTILCYARPYSPESKGKVERWFKTLHDQWTNVIDWTKFSSLDELNTSLNRYVEDKYNKSIHSSLSESPIDKFVSQMDRIRFISSLKELDYIFLYRVTRRVKNDATISLDKTLFEVPFKYVGDSIFVRYDPTSMDKAYIFSEDGKILDTIYPVRKIDNSKIRRERNVKPVDFSAFSPD
jgi:transposase InsO family protein